MHLRFSNLKSFVKLCCHLSVHLSMACSCNLIRPAKYAQGKEPVAAVNGPCALQIYGLLNNQHTLYWSAAWAGLRLAPATVGNRSFFVFTVSVLKLSMLYLGPSWGCIPFSRWVISRLDPSIPQLYMAYSQRKWIIHHIFCYLTQRVSVQKNILFWLGSRANFGYKMETFARASPTKKHLKFGRLLSDL